jgi:hypothetical protein
VLPHRLAVVLLLIAGTLFLPALSGWTAAPAAPAPPGAADQPPVQVIAAERYDVSPPLRDLPVIPPQPGKERDLWRPRLPRGDQQDVDPVVQRWLGRPLIPAPILTFEGVNNRNFVLPPDTEGDIGPNHYMQWVNLSFQIFNRAGGSLYGPANGNTLFSGFGGPCETTNDGDPIVLYDQLANRWLASQFALPNFPAGPFYQCLAVSQTGDPTGAWYRYAFQTSATKLNDYPKFGVWPDGYYMTANLFNQNVFTWAGTGVYAFDRASMLNGQLAVMMRFELPESDWGGMLPSDLDGSNPPPPGAPNYFVEVVDGAWDPANWPNDELHVHRFHVDWVNPISTTFNIAPVVVSIAPFDGVLCNFQRNCIPQPGTAVRLDAISDRLMYRLAYRNFGTYESLVVNHTVDVGTGPNERAGIRWYELRSPQADPPILYQEGTYAPADGLHRWMGSIAQDRQGNMLLGFSTSNGTAPNFPSIKYTGRLLTDPLGQMPQGEGVLMAGTGSQTHSASRWGDYSMMGVDPLDDCTFWYTNEYYQTTSLASWRTRIGYMKFPNCIAATPTPSPTRPVPTATNTPVPTRTNTPVPPTATPTPPPTRTNTPVPPTRTNTPVPTRTNTPLPTRTDTPVPPTRTDTPVPPTRTNTPLPTRTNTPLPTRTDTPVPPTRTDTPVPTRTNTPLPTRTNTPLPTRTDTPVPPTATNTPPRPTVTPTVPPTRTNTPVPPTRTNTPAPTRTNTPPAPTRTNTPPVPTRTITPPGPTVTLTALPTRTNTPMPTRTNTPLPTRTATPTATPQYQLYLPAIFLNANQP